MKLLIAIIVSALILAIGIVGGIKTANYCWEAISQQTEDPSHPLEPTPLEEYLISWELGEEILPYPFFGEWFDCDDAVLYSYLYLKALHGDYNIRIMKGIAWYAPTKQHLWLLVSDNATTFVYDYGIPVETTELYKGREISYGQLIYYVEKDL